MSRYISWFTTADGIKVLLRGPGLEPTRGARNACYVVDGGAVIIVEPLMIEIARRLWPRRLAEARALRRR